jgi:hypothetical protein
MSKLLKASTDFTTCKNENCEKEDTRMRAFLRAEVDKKLAKISEKDKKKMTFMDVLTITTDVAKKMIDHKTSKTLRECAVKKCNAETLNTLKTLHTFHETKCKSDKKSHSCNVAKNMKPLLNQKTFTIDNYNKITKILLTKI